MNEATVHTIPVPYGWSVEQAWEAIKRGDALPDDADLQGWANVLVRDGHMVHIYEADNT